MACKSGGCWIVDASRTKLLPDSMSRTIPIWAAVLNRLVSHLRYDQGIPEPPFWDVDLYMPTIIPREERETVIGMLAQHVDDLKSSGVILEQKKLVEQMVKPLRPFWITENNYQDHTALLEELKSLSNLYALLVCVGCRSREVCTGEETFFYTQGAADDEESWSRGLTPSLFWKHRKRILKHHDSSQGIENEIDQIVQESNAQECSDESSNRYPWSNIGTTGISIGSRRAGKPPDCWEHFDAILNVSMNNYEELGPINVESLPSGKFYLQLPVEEGKRDKRELQRWFPVGIVYLLFHLKAKRRVLLHCAQGKDRSVAVAIALFVFTLSFRDLNRPMHSFGILESAPIETLLDEDIGGVNSEEALPSLSWKRSGLPLACITAYYGQCGRKRLWKWIGDYGCDLSTVNKNTIQVALQAVQLFRHQASPSRDTIQKLNRLFLSGEFEDMKPQKR